MLRLNTYAMMGLIVLFLIGGCTHRRVSPELTFENAIASEKEPKRVASHQYVKLGLKDFKSLRYNKAALNFNKAIELDPANPFAYFYMAQVKRELKSLKQAVHLFEKSVDHFDQMTYWKSEALSMEGEVYLLMEQDDNAKGKFKEALRMDPGNKKARIGLETVLSRSH